RRSAAGRRRVYPSEKTFALACQLAHRTHELVDRSLAVHLGGREEPVVSQLRVDDPKIVSANYVGLRQRLIQRRDGNRRANGEFVEERWGACELESGEIADLILQVMRV